MIVQLINKKNWNRNLESSLAFKITCERTGIQDVNVFNSTSNKKVKNKPERQGPFKENIYRTL